MYLSKFTDYSYRILMYLGKHPNEIFTVEELSSILDLSTHHIKKIIYKLAKNGYICSSKGRNGGIKLGMEPCEINLGKLLELTEELNIVECFSQKTNSCNMNEGCKLKFIISDAFNEFKLKISNYTLADII